MRRAGKKYRDQRVRARADGHRDYFQLRPRLTAFAGFELPAVWKRTEEDLQLSIAGHERHIERARAEGDQYAERDHTAHLELCSERLQICRHLVAGVELPAAVELVMNGAAAANITEAANQGALSALQRHAAADERRRQPKKETVVYGSQSGPEREALGDLTAERLTVEVDPERLETGGDIRESYSADKVTIGRVRRPFQFGRELYVDIGRGHAPGSRDAMRLVRREDFTGETFEYKTWQRQVGYEGMLVEWRNVPYVLARPRLNLRPRDPRRDRLRAASVPTHTLATDAQLHVAAVASFTRPDELFKYQDIFRLPLVVENFAPSDERFTAAERAQICAATSAKQAELEARFAFGYWRINDIAHQMFERIGRAVGQEQKHKVDFITLELSDGSRWSVRRGALSYVTREEVLAVWPEAFTAAASNATGDADASANAQPEGTGSAETAAPVPTGGRCQRCGYVTPNHSLTCPHFDDTPPPPPITDGDGATADEQPGVALEEVRRYFSETILQPETDAAAHVAMFRRVIVSRPQLTDELNKFKKGRLECIGGIGSRGERKDELVERIVWDLIEDFTFGRLRAGGVSMRYFNDQAYRLELITKTVNALTDDDLDAHREGVAASRARYEAAQAERERAVTNPQTLEDFETCIRQRGIAALKRDKAMIPKGRGKSYEIERMIRVAGERELNEEELARFDELRADVAHERRAGLMIEKANIRRIEIGEGNYMEIVKSYHDKRQCEIWVVVLAEREDRTTFEELCIAARKLDGNYQREWKPTNTPGGFRFFSEAQAEKFVQLQSRDVFEISRLEKLLANRERVRQNAIGHFGVLADRMEDRATDALNSPRRLNTERRIMQAERADDTAREQLAMADTLRNYARDLQARLTRHTDRIRWRTHAEALDEILARAGGDVAKVAYPWPSVGKHTLAEIAREIGDRDGSKLVSSRILKLCREHVSDEIRFIGDERADLLRHFYRRARLHRTSRWTLDRIREALGHFKRLRLMNIDSLPELRAALREHLGRRVAVAEMTRAERVMREMYPGQFPPDYFPTPPDVVELMLEHAAIEDGMTILEPEAGGAHIANIVRDRYPNSELTLIEIAGLLVRALEAQGYRPIHDDFLRLPVPETGFDRVIANPPFGCDGLGTDITHVRRMWEWCKWGGRITTLMSEGVFYRGDGRAQEFRAWLEHVGGESFELPEGAFENSDRATSWAARIVVIDKIEQPGAGADVSSFIPAAAASSPALLSTSLN